LAQKGAQGPTIDKRSIDGEDDQIRHIPGDGSAGANAAIVDGDLMPVRLEPMHHHLKLVGFAVNDKNSLGYAQRNLPLLRKTSVFEPDNYARTF
jgi:hypothetical protein